MTDPNNENTPTQKESAETAAIPATDPMAMPPKKPKVKLVSSFEESDNSKSPSGQSEPDRDVSSDVSSDVAPQPTPVKAALTPKQEPTTAPIQDSSISIDEDPESPTVAAIVVDALSASITIAFTVLIVQDALPFL
ncbi:MAG: hypothetical protein ACPGGN_01935 [Opitutales bacterium]